MATSEENRLSTELMFYEGHKAVWLEQHRGEYVVVKEASPLGFFPSFKEAYTAGVVAWGIGTDFLVKQIVEHEPVFFVF